MYKLNIEKFYDCLLRKNKTQSSVISKSKVSSQTFHRMKNGESVGMSVVGKISSTLEIDHKDIFDFVGGGND